jgi:multiple sugar transport system substrate-binding protein
MGIALFRGHPVTWRRRLFTALATGLAVAPAVAACGSENGNVITLYYADQEYVPGIVAACNEQAGGEYEIVHRVLPREADGQREQMVRRLAAEDSDLDLLGLDVTWVPEFAEAGWLAEFTGQNKQAASEDVLKTPLETATWNGKLYAATMNTNVQLLWYDKELTPKPPTTWEEMLSMSQRLKEEGKPYEILFTGAQYEGLVVAFNTLVASAGGHILSEDGKRVAMDSGAMAGLEMLQKVATSGLVSPSLSASQEQQIHEAFAAKDTKAAFQINWPYVWSVTPTLGNEERTKNLAWAPLPGLDGHAGTATVGGFDIGVSAYSEKKDRAFKAALCLRNAEQQKYAAICAGVPPTLESLYTDESTIAPCKPEESQERPSMADAYPMRETILEELESASVRPLTPVYQNLSTVTSKLLSPPGDINVDETANELREQLTEALESQGVLP